VDVGSTEFIHERVIKERDDGAAVLLVSSELDEVLGLADRIAVMYRGRVLATLPGGASREKVGLLMAGITDEAAGVTDEAAGDAGEPEAAGQPAGEPPVGGQA
jgi:simple sugar transport system ATP-binding protein